jgi:hypothetical protein
MRPRPMPVPQVRTGSTPGAACPAMIGRRTGSARLAPWAPWAGTCSARRRTTRSGGSASRSSRGRLGLAAAAAIGDITGCTTYSAACSGSDTILPWLAQAAILGLLLLLPPLARVFVGGTIAVLLALVPVTAVLVILGAGGAPQGAFVLGALLAAAWIGGVAVAARGQSRAVA